MKKFKIKFKKIEFRQVSVNELDDRMLLLNLYLTQALTFIIGLIWVIFQQQNLISLLSIPTSITNVFLYGAGLALVAVLADMVLSKFVPDEAADDGGVNERIFGKRPVWQIVLICLIVAICEELLFRGAMQHAFGPYWTSIIFAVIHVRYLKHWIPTGLVFSISYGLGWIYIQTDSIWTPILAHFLFDLIMGLMIRFRREA